MPTRCSVPGCRTKAEKGSGPRFYCIPSEINFTGKASPLRVSRRKRWVAALGLQHLGHSHLKNVRICGDHFITGKPANQYFVQHPDWVPTVHLNLQECSVSSSPKVDTNRLHTVEQRKASHGSVKKPTPAPADDASEFSPDDLKYSMPQKRCWVASCLNRMIKTKNSIPPIFYHKFPEDLLTRSRWVFLCQKKGTWEPEHSYVCSEHFTPQDYLRDGVLNQAAVPSVKLISPEINTSSNKGDLIILEGRRGVCSVPWCKSTSAEGKHMILFPDDGVTVKLWVDSIFGAQVPVVPYEKAVICQDHFVKGDLIESSHRKTAKQDAIPSLFRTSFKLASSPREPYKRKHDPSKKKVKLEGILKNEVEDELQMNKDDSLKSKDVPDKIVKVVRVVQKQILSDHNYTGVDSNDSNLSQDEVKKRKLDSSDTKAAKLCKGDEADALEGITEVSAYNNIEELMADLMGGDSVNVDNKNENLGLTSEGRRILEEGGDSLDDYSDYSETDSESDSDGGAQCKPFDKMSQSQLEELAEARRFQLNDLKSENQELVEENERLRNELKLLKSDPEHAAVTLEKSKFMSLVVKLLRNFLNVDQILHLAKRGDPTNGIVWSSETLDKALEISKACSDAGYDMLLESGFPLPPRRLFSMLDRDFNHLSVVEPKSN